MAFPLSDPPVLNIALLSRLREAGGRFLPLDFLGSDLSRVQHDLDHLSAFGFQIERHPYQGAAYHGPAQRLCPDQIEYELATSRIGKRIAVWNRVGSTSDLAAQAATTPANDGLVVLAEEQSAGRGQRGRRWSVPAQSSILLSVLLFPPDELLPFGKDSAAACARLTALGAVATAEVVADVTGAEARIKWPNDVRVEGRKLAGVLVEQVRGPTTSHGFPPGRRRPGVVIGIGLNGNIRPEQFSDELRPRACSLSMLARAPIDRSEVARGLIRGLDAWYDRVLNQGVGALSAAWRDRSEHLGGIVRVSTPEGPLQGILVDLDLQEGMTLEILASIDGVEDAPASASTPRAGRTRLAPGKILAVEA